MDAKEIETVDTVYRTYYQAYRSNQMIGVIEVATETGLSVTEVELAIKFLTGERQIKFDNKGYDPITSGAVYKLTDEGYSWFAKTNWSAQLLGKQPKSVAAVEASNPATIPNQRTRKTNMKIFISHASANKAYGDALVELLTSIGLQDHEIVYTSNTAYGIPIGVNIFNWLKSQISENCFVVYLLSDEYYKSIACLNEMGAAWVIENEHAAIFLPNFDLGSKEFQNGAIDPREIGFRINDRDRLTQFCQGMKKHFSITDNLVIFGQRIDRFLADVNANAGNLKPASPDQPTTAAFIGEDTESETELERTVSEASALRKELVTSKKIFQTGIILYDKFLNAIAEGKFSDSELLLLHYILDRSKVKLRTGWQTENEIKEIQDWEEIYGLNPHLSSQYESTIRKFELRNLTETSALTSAGNPKEVQLKEEISKHILELPNFVLEAIQKVVENHSTSTNTESENDDLPF